MDFRRLFYRFPKPLVSIFIIGFFVADASFAQQKSVLKEAAIIPKPVQYELQKGSFKLNNATSLNAAPAINPTTVLLFKQAVFSFAHTVFTHQKSSGKNSIALTIDSVLVPQKEGYQLSIGQNQIKIIGHDDAGVFYGTQTLLQLISHDKPGNYSINNCKINDYPRFGYRGMELDVSRHLFPVSAIKKWINILAFYKINTFHWHLTDDQGWRIEIKKYPKLQSAAAYRNETLIGHKKEMPHQFDGRRYGGFYSQQEVKDIVKFAAERHISIIPEIEMPGHALAALSAYPALGCTGGPYQTATFWGVFDDVYCAGNEETFHFLENVLDEVITLFPSNYIHIGGDECPKTKWKTCPKCQKRIADEHLKDEQQLQTYFMGRIEKYLKNKNKKVIGWDEILEGGLTPDATVMSWRGEEGGIAAAHLQHEVVMTPEKFVYLDYYQSLNPNEPIAAGGYTPLSKIYGYEPVPAALKPEETKYIKGVQANVWSEYLTSEEKAEYMVFPRVFALAEIAWSSKADRNYADFLNRLRLQKPMIQQLKINAAEVFDEITDTVSVQKNSVLVSLKSTKPNAEIRYTTNGKIPDKNSIAYQKPVSIFKPGTLKAALFTHGKLCGRVFEQSFNISKSTGQKVSLKYSPQGNFNPGNNNVLVNGLSGSNRYNDNQWLGFAGEDLEAVIDLESVQQISEIGTHILKYHWQKMWEPKQLTFEISTDGVTFSEVYRQQSFPANGINTVHAVFMPVKARYIKIKAENKGLIPQGEYGAGGKVWLLTDEFTVN
ncbi:glycoside hydrolase family 20 protein [uncultured Mucilaginibacter sp.]|uniref:glycoside hydrolase family 20 protein n=1 Tax=uncultured Mucilaginibacter sp. TaxID=797541 RepID=UPI002619C1F8|nr:glycoside hydrolase family 20 protein [uncultured Mucilaginibacter sp.]